MDKKWKRRVGRLDIQTPPPKLKKTRYIDDNGIIRETIHDGTFSPPTPTPPTPTVDYMYFEAVEVNSTVALTSTLTIAPNLEYSTDGETWQEWQHTTADGAHTFDTLTLTEVGDRVYLRGDNPNGLGAIEPELSEDPVYSNFVMTGKIAAGGNIMSLLDKDAEMTEIPDYGFLSLFGDITGANPNTSITSAASMSTVTTIGYEGCSSMYIGCTSLTTVADMPSLTTIGERGCYYMYTGCTALTAAADTPELTSIRDFGCYVMYEGCAALTAVTDMPALITIGSHGCDGMYRGCMLLTSAADMPVLTTIGENGCWFMYSYCPALTSAAAMPALITIDAGGCSYMYDTCLFNMSDDGSTLNFAFPTPPITAGETTYETAYDVGNWMGNTNGFTEP